MVGFWPWRSSDSSPASFEKTLSSLSAKITDTQARLDRLRASSRRAKVLWTLYLSFAYLVCAIVLLLVVGYKNLGAYEWTGLAGGPILIYAIRAALTGIYNFRIDSLESRLKEYQQERAKTIQKLKDATKYDSTLELLEKYGGGEAKPPGAPKKKPSDGEGSPSKDAQNSPNTTPNRTRLPPPPTANIPRPSDPSTMPMPMPLPGAEFAPNADFHPLPPPIYAPPESHWYDRIFDVLLGEDETAPKNRIVLLCRACRLVNGQAPPGTKTLADVGAWKCMACGALNGEMDEGARIVREVLAEQAEEEEEEENSSSSDAVEVSKEDVPVPEEESSGARKRKGKGK